jgi:spore coat polysaccharide biosynthesis protein SpsF
MMELAGEPLVGRILERVKRCTKLDEIVLAVPNTSQDKPLISLARKFEVAVFSGSENDLVDRYYRAAMAYHADIIVRIPADNTTPQPEEIDRIIEHHLVLGRPGFSSNLAAIEDSGYPDGIGAEVFDFGLLKEVFETVTDPIKREHVHLNFFDYETGIAVDSKWCPISTLQCPKEFRRPDLVLDVNTKEQYEFMVRLYDALYYRNPNFTIVDIIEWYEREYAKKDGGSDTA